MRHHAPKDWVHHACGGVNRIEAYFSGVAYAPHRHDTYAVGLTLQGVQSFDYRCATRHALPGDVVVLYPDELHDGRAGTNTGFRYRTIYIEPSMIQSVLRGRRLPFIDGGVSSDSRLLNAVSPLLEQYDRPMEVLEFHDAVYDLAMALDEVSVANEINKPINFGAAELARQYIHEQINDGISMEELESATGRDRWALSKDFRAMFGTSPYRYLTMRRLDKARNMLLAGISIADAAIACSFSDQSHLTRQFRKTYGITPKKWIKALKGHCEPAHTIIL